jgi:ubiquinone/menaquinone biosynthesis C-methylase UbiE
MSLNRPREYRGLVEMLDLSTGDTVLDVGSGDGFWTARFADRSAHVTGLEPDDHLMALARNLHRRPNVGFVKGVAESLPFPNQTFSKVVSVSCLEHFADPFRALVEMARVLKPGGRLALSVDSLLAENSSTAFRDWHRRRHFVTEYYSVRTLLSMMERAGIVCEPARTVHLFRSRIAGRVRYSFIRYPRTWLPLFPVLLGLCVACDRIYDDTHGQIVMVTGTRP